MARRVTIDLRSPGFILGVRGVDVLLDGAMVRTAGFGETVLLECPAGEHTLQLRMRAVLNRRSNAIRLAASDGERRFTGRYSRMWGTLRLRAEDLADS